MRRATSLSVSTVVPFNPRLRVALPQVTTTMLTLSLSTRACSHILVGFRPRAHAAIPRPVDNQTVFECKYELDSLCGFLKLSRGYYDATKDSSLMNGNWSAAIDQIFTVMEEQSQSTFDEDLNFVSYYNWTGTAGSRSPPVNNHGNGEPKAYTGLVGTHHRPNDILSTYVFLTPANAMLSVELSRLAGVLDDAGMFPNASSSAREWSSQISAAIWNSTVSVSQS